MNIAEILDDCPKGTKLYSPIFGDVYLDKIRPHIAIVVKTDKDQGDFKEEFLYDGRYGMNGECMLFPSKENRDWSTFRKHFKPGDVLVSEYGNLVLFSHTDKDDIVYYHCLLAPNRFSIQLKCGIGKTNNCTLASEGQKQRLFEQLKKSGYNYNAETNTLEKLIVPKFKVGDKIISKDFKGRIRIINAILDNEYNLFGGEKVPFSNQDYWKLVYNKCDISTWKPFDKVLVRYNKDNIWHATFFSHYDPKLEFGCYSFVTTDCKSYPMCIPYNDDTKHLIGTDQDCDEYYKVW